MADAISVKYEDSRFGNLLLANGLGLATDYLSGYGNIFGDSDLGRGMGTLFSSGVSSVGNTLANNVLKGTTLAEGLGVNAGASLAGAGAGLAANYIGRGINSLGGNSMLSRGIGQGVATGLGTIGGQALGSLIKTGTASNSLTSSINAIKTFNAALKTVQGADAATKAAKMAGVANLAGLGMTVVGSALGAALGPSKEYGGKYGNITLTMDTVYDAVTAGVNFIPGVGLVISGALALNKGLGNLFGSTSGMTTQDAILGSAFMPAPVKWLNMAGAKTTSNFNNLSWLNSEKATSFMGNAFGNLNDKFDKAREEAGKTYGLASRGAYNDALKNLAFANTAWGLIMDMANLNELQNIRSLYMTSINNLRYAQNIQGGWNPIYRGKQGMKIFNNATNHNIGMRLLSAAALIDNKQMILSAGDGTKMRGRMPAHPKTGSDKDPAATKAYEEWQLELNARHEEAEKQQAEELVKKRKLQEEAAARFNQLTNLVLGVMNLQASEVPFTGQEYQQAAENLRQKKVEKAEELEKGLEAALMADLAVSAKPFLLRGFRWAFNKAGLLVKIPNKNSLKGFNFSDLPQEKYIYNNRTGEFDVIAPKKEWIQKGENDLVPNYFTSSLEKERLVATGISPEEALDIMDIRWINSIEALPGKLRNLGKNTFGDAQNINGRAFIRYNSRKGVKASLNDASTTLNTVFHELGGHGSSLNIGYGTQTIPINMKDILMKIYKHNESLRPLLKPFYQAIKDGNFDLAKNLAKNEGIELSSLKGSSGDIDFKSLKDFIKYMEENLEYSARAIGSNMSNHYGMPNGWNEKQLRDIFTKESVDKLLKNVWNYGVPITVGGSTTATLYNKSK